MGRALTSVAASVAILAPFAGGATIGGHEVLPAVEQAQASGDHVDGWVTAQELPATAPVGACGVEVTLHNGDSVDYLKTIRDTDYHSQVLHGIRVGNLALTDVKMIAKPSLTATYIVSKDKYNRSSAVVTGIMEEGLAPYGPRDVDQISAEIQQLSADQESDCTPPPVNVCLNAGKLSMQLNSVVTDAKRIKGNRFATGKDRDARFTYLLKNTGTETIDGNDPENVVRVKIPKNASVAKGTKIVNGRAILDIKTDIKPGQTIKVGGLLLKIDGKGKATSVVAGQAVGSTEVKGDDGVACDTAKAQASRKIFDASRINNPTPGVTG